MDGIELVLLVLRLIGRLFRAGGYVFREVFGLVIGLLRATPEGVDAVVYLIQTFVQIAGIVLKLVLWTILVLLLVLFACAALGLI